MTTDETDPLELPDAVTAYLVAHTTLDPRETAALFAERAVVVDDGQTYTGHDEIIGWRQQLANAFSYDTTRLSVGRTGAIVSVTERVEGDFSGGTVDLTSSFTLDSSGRIATLGITAAD